MRAQKTGCRNRRRKLFDESRLKTALEILYARLNRREFVEPDPLQYLFDYSDIRDREIVGLAASGLSFGNVKTIINSIEKALSVIKSPREFVENSTASSLEKQFSGFRHRWAGPEHLAALFVGIGKVVKKHGSLNECFLSHFDKAEDSVLNAASLFAKEINAGGGMSKNPLLAVLTKGSACKKLNLYLRWMIRKDAVDPGGWIGVSKSKLVVPLDTHHFQVGTALGFTKRKSKDAKAALEITDAYRRISPDDPVKYDFAVTRFGIRGEIGLEDFLRECGVSTEFMGVNKAASGRKNIGGINL